MSVGILSFFDMKKLKQKNKKGQIQIMQTVFVVIILFIVLFIAFLFYMQYSQDNANAEFKKMETKKAILIASSILSIPEISCSQKLDIKQNCFDASKMIVFDTNSNLEYYANYFYFSKVSVVVLYGNQSSGICAKDAPLEFPNCNEFLLYENVLLNYENNDFYMIPVSIYNPFMDEYFIGYVNLEVYL